MPTGNAAYYNSIIRYDDFSRSLDSIQQHRLVFYVQTPWPMARPNGFTNHNSIVEKSMHKTNVDKFK